MLLSRDKRSESDDKQSRQYVSDCVSRVYRLLSALVCGTIHALNLNLSLIQVLMHTRDNKVKIYQDHVHYNLRKYFFANSYFQFT